MNYLQAILLGFFQGVSEFLPISSSGHLAVLQRLFGIEKGNLFFSEMLHVGTLVSIFIVYRKDIGKMIVEFLKLIVSLVKREKNLRLNRYQRYAVMILAATVPTVILALLFKDTVEKLYGNMNFVAVGFLITGILLWMSSKRYREEKDIEGVTLKDAVIIGTLQGVAIVPGISRSGSTIVGALFRGLKQEVATEFSFLLAIPAILGGGILGISDALKEGGAAFSMPLLAGVLTSAVVGVFAIRGLIRILNRKKLHYFSFYLWLLGAVILIHGFLF